MMICCCDENIHHKKDTKTTPGQQAQKQEVLMSRSLAVQLYSLREQAQKDFIGVLKTVADIGYRAVEPAGFWDLRPREFRRVLDDLGLKIYSSHSPWAQLGNLGEVMEILDILGLDKAICGYAATDFQDMEAIKRTAETTNHIQEILSRNGFTLCQHNHHFEFERLDGTLKYDLYAELCPNVQFEIDVFWSANYGAEDPVAMLKRFANRATLIHIKDGLLKDDGHTDPQQCRVTELRALGEGDLDIPGLVAHLPQQIDHIVVELDFCNIDMVTALERSYRYMTENGLAVGNK